MGVDTSQTQKAPALDVFSKVPSSTSQATQDILVPYFCGQRRIKTNWVGPAYNTRSVAVPSASSGGGKGAPQSSGSNQYKYYADMIAIVAMGPCDNLYAVYIDDNVAFQGFISQGAGTVTAVDLGAFGVMWMWWGRNDQTQPSLFNHGSDVYGGHRGKVRLEFRGLYFGSVGKTSAPNVEVVIERFPDFPGFPHNDSRLNITGKGVNPIACVYEILNNSRYGCGVPQSQFDITFIGNQITALAATGFYFSPLIDTQQPVRSIIQDLLRYFDGYV
jgi:hypothetical protein